MQRTQLRYSGGLRVVAKDNRPRYARRDLLEQFQPPAAHGVVIDGKSGAVAAGPRETGDITDSDRVRNLDKYDRHRARRGKHRSQTGRTIGQDDIRSEGDQL